MPLNDNAVTAMKGAPVHAIALPSNQPADRFYAGGGKISAFRRETPAPPMTPEDWVASTTSVRGHAPSGQTRLPSGELLASAIDRDPIGWLGAAHVERFGVDPRLLVKLLDAGQRLPVHAHPNADFARHHLDVHHGKAEAWYILSPGTVYLGLTRSLTTEALYELVRSQQTEKLLELTHLVHVEANDTVFVPTGLLHAIGEGIFLAEVQEPEDLSILLEWKNFALDGEADGHLGLGFDTALTAVDREGRTRGEIEALVRRSVADGSVLASAADQYFRLERVSSNARFDAGFAVVIVLDGILELEETTGAVQYFESGVTIVVPAAASPFTLSGGTALVARPPLVDRAGHDPAA